MADPDRLAYRNDPLMAGAWLSAITVGAQTEGVLAAYEESRGRPFLLAGRRAPIDRMIDEATGADRAAVEDFVAWFNEFVWGDDPFTDTMTTAERMAASSEEERGENG